MAATPGTAPLSTAACRTASIGPGSTDALMVGLLGGEWEAALPPDDRRRAEAGPAMDRGVSDFATLGGLAALADREVGEHRGRLPPEIGGVAGLGVPQRPPDPLWGARQVDVPDPERAQGVDHRVLHGGGGTDGGRLADALRAERVHRGGGLGVGDVVVQQV